MIPGFLSSMRPPGKTFIWLTAGFARHSGELCESESIGQAGAFRSASSDTGKKREYFHA